MSRLHYYWPWLALLLGAVLLYFYIGWIVMLLWDLSEPISRLIP